MLAVGVFVRGGPRDTAAVEAAGSGASSAGEPATRLSAVDGERRARSAASPRAALRLRFVDAAGTPVPGAELWSAAGELGTRTLAPERQQTLVARADAAGRVELDTPRAPLLAKAAGFCARVVDPAPAPGEGAEPRAVTLERAGALEVVCRHADGRPAEGVLVALSPIGLPRGRRLAAFVGRDPGVGPDGIHVAVSGPDGLLRFEGLTPRRNAVAAFAPGLARADDLRAVHVVAGGIDRVELRFTAPLAACVELVGDRMIGIAYATDGDAWNDRAARDDAILMLSEDLQRTFPGTYPLLLVPRTPRRSATVAATVTGETVGPVELNLQLVTPDELAPTIVQADTIADLPELTLGEVHLLRHDGTPFGALEAELMPAERDPETTYPLVLDGTPFLAPPGVYRLQLDDGGLLAALPSRRITLPGTTELTLEHPLCRTDFRIRTGAGEPLEHFTLVVHSRGRQRSTTVNYGAGAFHTHLPPGPARVKLSGPGLETRWVEIDVPAGAAEHRVDLTVEFAQAS